MVYLYLKNAITRWFKSFTEKLTVAHIVNNFPIFTESEEHYHVRKSPLLNQFIPLATIQ